MLEAKLELNWMWQLQVDHCNLHCIMDGTGKMPGAKQISFSMASKTIKIRPIMLVK